jgi:hypothetical protein
LKAVGEGEGGDVISIDLARMRQSDASKLVETRIWRTREGQRLLITSDRDVSFVLAILAKHGFSYERPREEDGVMTVRAVRK